MHKSKFLRPWQLEPTSLLLPSPSDGLSDDHQLDFLLDLVEDHMVSATRIASGRRQPAADLSSQILGCCSRAGGSLGGGGIRAAAAWRSGSNDFGVAHALNRTIRSINIP